MTHSALYVVCEVDCSALEASPLELCQGLDAAYKEAEARIDGYLDHLKDDEGLDEETLEELFSGKLKERLYDEIREDWFCKVPAFDAKIYIRGTRIVPTPSEIIEAIGDGL